MDARWEPQWSASEKKGGMVHSARQYVKLVQVIWAEVLWLVYYHPITYTVGRQGNCLCFTDENTETEEIYLLNKVSQKFKAEQSAPKSCS